MGLIFGRRAPEIEQRASMGSTWWPTFLGSFDSATVAGTGALASVAVRSATDLICSLVSELPLKVYSGGREIQLPGNMADPGDDGAGHQDWVYRLLGSWLHRGNAYGLAGRDRLGYLRTLDLLDPDRVTVTVTDNRTLWSHDGRPQDDLVHLRVNPMAGILLGFSPVEANAIPILASIAATRFGYQWFVEGTHPSSLLINTEVDIDAETARTVLDRWRAMKSGTREPAVLGRGWELRGLDITPEQAQLMGLIGMSEAQACRIFGPGIAEVLGYDSGGSMTYANVQDRRSDLLVMSLTKWVRRVERQLTEMLPRPQEARFDRDALLETTTAARYAVHKTALDAGFRTVNEVRADEDMPPVEWGDGPAKSPAPPAEPPAAPEEDDTV